MKKILWVSVIFSFFFMDSAFAEIKEYHDVKTTKLEAEYSDLEFLGDVLKGKDVVGIGEGTHGTKDFYEMRHRLFRYMVEKLDYKAMVIEQGMGEIEIINRYIQGDDISIDFIMKETLFTPWQTREVEEFFIWLRKYNEKQPEEKKVRLYGCDIQETTNLILSEIEEFYNSVNPEKYKEIYKSFVDGPPMENIEFYDLLNTDLKLNREEYVKKDKEGYYRLSKIIENKVIANGAWDIEVYSRDKIMARNTLWVQNHEKEFFNNEKIVLWAHNRHLAVYEETQGGVLKEALGDSYYNIAQIFHKGYFIADHISRTTTGLKRYHDNGSPEKGSAARINTMFPEKDMIYFNIKDTETNKELNEIFMSNISGNEYTAGPAEKQPTYSITYGEEFDAVLYFNETTAAENFIDEYTETIELNTTKKADASKVPTLLGAFVLMIAVTVGIVYKL